MTSNVSISHCRINIRVSVIYNLSLYDCVFSFPLPLTQDLQEAQRFSKEGAPERLSGINERTRKRDAVYGAHRTQETEGGLTLEEPSPNSHCSALANAARRYIFIFLPRIVLHSLEKKISHSHIHPETSHVFTHIPTLMNY